jgi:hypothetical protein
MLIELDLDEAKRLKITTNQFLLVKFIVDGINFDAYQSTLSITNSDIENLISKNILTIESKYDESDLTSLFVTQEFIDKFKARNFFDEFFDTYPISATRPDGTKDYLRGDISRCRKTYDKIVGKSKSKHEHILECLKFEVSTRRKSGSMSYMKRMSKWLFAEEWLLYDEFLKDKKVQNTAEKIYGTEID